MGSRVKAQTESKDFKVLAADLNNTCPKEAHKTLEIKIKCRVVIIIPTVLAKPETLKRPTKNIANFAAPTDAQPIVDE